LKRVTSKQTTKQVMIAQPPPLLCLHISRSTFSPYGEIRKNSCWVRFPILLDLSPYCTSGQLNLDAHAPLSGTTHRPSTATSLTMSTNHTDQTSHDFTKTTFGSAYTSAVGDRTRPIWYRLRAMVVHYGGHHSGHFVTFRQVTTAGSPTTQQSSWYRVSDDEVTPASEADLEAENPYLLIYERITPPEKTNSTPTPLSHRPIRSRLAGKRVAITRSPIATRQRKKTRMTLPLSSVIEGDGLESRPYMLRSMRTRASNARRRRA
jgi:hypothetical protein